MSGKTACGLYTQFSRRQRLCNYRSNLHAKFATESIEKFATVHFRTWWSKDVKMGTWTPLYKTINFTCRDWESGAHVSRAERVSEQTLRCPPECDTGSYPIKGLYGLRLLWWDESNHQPLKSY
jgi:hypothetical protein